MNSCELNLSRGLKNQFSGKSVSEIVNEIKKISNIDESAGDISSWLMDILSNTRLVESDIPSVNLSKMFYYERNGKKILDAVSLLKFKQKVIETVLDKVFNSSNTPTQLNDQTLNMRLNALVSRTNIAHGWKNISDKAIYYFNNFASNKKAETLGDTKNLVDFFIATQLPLLVKSYLNNIIKYDDNTGKYHFAIKSHIKQDWNDDIDEKPAELNGLLKLMCESTKMLDANGNEIPRMRITQNSLMWALNQFLNNLNDSEYESTIDNPRRVIDLLNEKIQAYEQGGDDVSILDFSASGFDMTTLWGNILYSFYKKWLNPESNFYKSFYYNATGNQDTNPIDIIIGNVRKYSPQSYLQYDTDGNVTELKLDFGENSQVYSRLVGNLESNKDNLINALYNAGIIQQNHKTGNYTIIEGAISNSMDNKKINVIKRLFGNNLNMNDNDLIGIKYGIMAFVDFFNSKLNTIARFKAKGNYDPNKYNGQELSHIFTTIINNSNRYNPYAIDGAVRNALDKALPTIGLANVGNTIEKIIYENRVHERESNVKYDNAINKANSEGRITKIVKPIAPAAHSALYSQSRSGSRLYSKTSYRTTLSANINGEKVVKDPSNFSSEEWFEITCNQDILTPLLSEDGKELRIQAITPSDKSKIPIFIFNKAEFLAKYANGIKPTYNNIEKLNKILFESLKKQINSYYKQYLLNSINDFIQVFDLGNVRGIGQVKYTDANDLGCTLDYLNSQVTKINNYLLKNRITEEKLNDALFAFNQKYGLNKNIAKYIDYSVNDGLIELSEFNVRAVNLYNDENFFFNILEESLHKFPKSFRPNGSAEAMMYLDKDNHIDKNNIMKSTLFTFFAIQGLLSTDLLVNTVGLPNAHKYGGKNFMEIDSKGQLTMVKRMVALTMTQHQCNRDIFSGLPNQINMMTVGVQKKEMYTYAGTTTDDNGWSSDIECWDGAMIGTLISHTLTKQSITDTKPYGLDLKLIMHDFNVEKSASHLPKLASFAITNAIIRCFENDQARSVDAYNPEDFLKLQLRVAKLKNNDIRDNEIIGYNGYEVNLYNAIHKIINDDGSEIIVKSKFSKNLDDNLDVEYVDITTGESIRKLTNVGTDLYSIWKYVLGGANSCNENGDFNENSQLAIVNILNNVGKKITDSQLVKSQRDVDQYLKKQIIHFFPTNTVQKALQAPVVDIHKALDDELKAYTLQYNIDHFGIQMDADHSAEDSTIHEITQLISFIAEHGYAPDVVKKVYKSLAQLLVQLGNKVFINPDSITYEDKRMEAKNRLDNIFGLMIQRVFSNPKLDVKGYANELLTELNQYNNLMVPYSDHQILGQLHTTIGSYLNKFIARNWTGRADVLMPSHNLFMIYEDEDGIRYMANDYKFSGNTKVKIKKHLHDFVWNEDGTMTNQMLSKAIINPYEMMPQDIYYKVDINAFNSGVVTSSNVQIVVMDTWANLMDARAEYEKPKNDFIYIKAYDLPRNLRPKHAFLEFEKNGVTTKIGLFHLKTIQEISEYGRMCEDKNLVSQKQENLAIKKQKQKYLDSVVLPLIAKLNNGEKLTNDEWIIINRELPNKIQDELIDDISEEGIFHYDKYTWRYSQLDSESITTNNYSKVFGIKDMNISEISQRGAEYFREKLEERFNNDIPNIANNGYVLFTSDGEQTNVVFDDQFDINTANRDYIEVDIDVDEDGYRLSSSGKQMYKLPNEAKVYRSNVSGLNIETIVLKEGINDLERPKDHQTDPKIYLLDSDYWIFYKKNGVRADLRTIDKLDNNIINAIAQKQYESFLQAKLDVVARIPSQSMAFAMVMENIGYLPFSNNLRIVPLEHFYIQGSDVDIDKAYALMAYLNRNGLYKEKTFSTIEYIENESELNIDDVNLNNDIINTIINRGSSLEDTLKDVSDIIWTKLNNGEDVNICVNYIIKELKGWAFNNNNLLQFVLNNIETIKKVNSVMAKKGSGEVNIMQNTIRKNIIDLYHNPKTLFAANYPTTMVPVREAVEVTGRDKELRNSLDPTTNILVNQTCAVGKKGVGISANSQKGFYALTTTFEDKFKKGESTLNPVNLGVLPYDWASNDKDYLFSLGFAGARINLKSIQELVNIFEDPEKSPIQIPGKQIINDGVVSKDVQYVVNYVNGVFYVHKSTIIGPNVYGQVYILEMTKKELEDNGIDFIYNKEITDNNIDVLEAMTSKMKWMKIGTDIHDVTCTLINGAIISSSTDNAKEMRMDLLNMTPEILPAYEFLLSLGIDIQRSAKIMLDPIIPALVSISRGNLFKGEKSRGRIASILKNRNKKLFNNFKDTLSSYLVSEFGISKENIGQKLNILNEIFKGADELTEFSQILSINGGIQVTTGSPIIYEFNFQNKINKKFSDTELKEYGKFSYDKFVISLSKDDNEEYAETWANRVQEKTLAYNILSTLLSVDHFRSMIQVPAQFNRIMETLSGDMRHLHKWLIDKQAVFEVNENNIKKILRGINDKKIFDFLRTLDFEYRSKFKYELNGSKVIDNTSILEDDQEHVYNINSNDCLGILNFKKTVEEEILPIMIEKFGDDLFVQNIIFNSFLWSSANTRVLALASDIDLTDARMTTENIAIKSKYDEIKNEEINGHIIADWMFLYDLIVYHHLLNRNSFSPLFGDIGYNNNNNVARSWVEFVNDYDNNYFDNNRDYSELSNLDLEKTLMMKNQEDREREELSREMDPNAFSELMKKKLPYWLKPNILPLFVNTGKTEEINYHNANILSRLFYDNLIFAKIC